MKINLIDPFCILLESKERERHLVECRKTAEERKNYFESMERHMFARGSSGMATHNFPLSALSRLMVSYWHLLMRQGPSAIAYEGHELNLPSRQNNKFSTRKKKVWYVARPCVPQSKRLVGSPSRPQSNRLQVWKTAEGPQEVRPGPGKEEKLANPGQFQPDQTMEVAQSERVSNKQNLVDSNMRISKRQPSEKCIFMVWPKTSLWWLKFVFFGKFEWLMLGITFR